MIFESILNNLLKLSLYSLSIKILALILVVMIIVIVHEFGHYIFARIIGSEIEIFSIGIGKKLISFTDRNKTIWQICALPFGGYVKIKGENGENLGDEKTDSNSLDSKNNNNDFENKKPIQKILVVLAGPFFNFLLSFILIFFIFSFHGKPSIDISSSEYEIIIKNVMNDSQASEIGLKEGDIIKEINETKINNFKIFKEILDLNKNKEIKIKFFSVNKNEENEVKFHLNNEGKLGIAIAPNINFETNLNKLGFLDAIKESIKYNIELIKMTIQGVVKLFSKPSEMKNIGGLIQIADFSGSAIQSGLINFLFFLALLSINLGVINLFPIPALDGGRFIFYFLDMIFIGKLISPKIRSYSIGLSFIFLIGLMILANINDIYKIFVK